MAEVQYTQLIDLIEHNLDKIETIKEQYLFLLSELSSASYIETPLFLEKINNICQIGTIIVGVISEPSSNIFKIVASGTIIIEPKLIRECKYVGHIEDIVVSTDMRGKGISQKILDILKLIARENNCYKVILDCEDDVKNVYIKNGFHIKGIQMAEYF